MRIIGMGKILALSVLALTGFPALLFSNVSLSGYPLILHFSAAPVFAVCLALSIVARAYGNRFTNEDSSLSSSSSIQKLCFWILCTLGTVIVLSMAFCLSSRFGPDEQVWLVRVHAWAAFLFLPFYIAHIYLSLRAKGES